MSPGVALLLLLRGLKFVPDDAMLSRWRIGVSHICHPDIFIDLLALLDRFQSSCNNPAEFRLEDFRWKISFCIFS